MIKTIEDIVRELGGVWPSGESTETHLYKFADGRYAYVAGLPGWSSGTSQYICTCTEFEECAKILRNEPSWKDAPAWAVAKAQDSDGGWYWYEFVPRLSTASPAKSKLSGSKRGRRVIYAGKGEVIGDWKQTLRLRPKNKEKQMEDKKQMNASEAVYGFASWLTCRKDKVCFSSTDDSGIAADLVKEFCSANALPEISDKWPDNLAHPGDKNDWHKRGEFPPAGTVCEMLSGNYWKEVKIVGWGGENVVIASDEIVGRYRGLCAEPSDFRPIQTGRERWIEQATAFFTSRGFCPNKHDLGACYDAGLAKMPEDK